MAETKEEAKREALILTQPGIPPCMKLEDVGQEALNSARRGELRALAEKTSCCPPAKEPLALSIRYIRKDGRSDAASIVSGITKALEGVLYDHISRVQEISYSERPGEAEHYQVHISPTGFQIPALLEPLGEIGAIKDDPSKVFPDDPASRWMLALLLANEDIGLSMKLTATYLGSPTISLEPHAQYRTSHLLYFWRLWLAHIFEAWTAFNDRADHEVVRKVKAVPEIETLRRKINERMGRKVSGQLTARNFMEKCRHVAFHYYEEDGDKWAEQLLKLKAPFNLCVTHGDYKDVDSRWPIADEYLLSRLNPFEFTNKVMHEETRELALDLIELIRLCQKGYFEERDPKFLQGIKK